MCMQQTDMEPKETFCCVYSAIIAATVLYDLTCVIIRVRLIITRNITAVSVSKYFNYTSTHTYRPLGMRKFRASIINYIVYLLSKRLSYDFAIGKNSSS